MTGTGPGGDGHAAAPTPPPRWAAWWVARSRRTRLGIAVAVIAAAVAAGLAAAGSAGGATPGRPGKLPVARNFSVPVLDHPGQRLSLSGYPGKPLILNFFASWCDPCQRETPLLARYYRAARGRVIIIGLDENDPVQAARRFVRKTGVSYPVGVDAPPMPTAGAYQVTGLPQTFFLNSRHQVVKRVYGAVTQQELTAGTALIDRRQK